MLKKQLISLSLLSASLVTLPALANETAPEWTYVQASYISVDADRIGDIDPDFDGFGIEGSYAFGEFGLIKGSYRGVSDTIRGIDVDVDLLSIGLGVRTALSGNTDLFGFVSYEDVEIDFEGLGDDDSDGFGLELGVRSKITENIELEGSVGFIDRGEEDNEAEFSVAGFYSFYENLQAGLGYTLSDDADTVSVTLRYNF